MRVTALDIATSTGWAAGEIGAHPIWGSHRAAPVGANPGRVFGAYRDWLERQLDMTAPDMVWAEDQYISQNRDVVARLWGLRAVTEMVCEDRNLRLRWVETTKVCRFFTSVGRHANRVAKKDATLAVCRLYGWHPANDDEGDALAIWMYAEAQLAPQLAQQRTAGPLWAIP